MDTILYTVAKDGNGNLIAANNAKKTEQYYCPVCEGQLILKKSGNTGLGAKRPHFAHKTLTPNCTPETALHYSFKHLLEAKLNQYLTSKQPLMISWKCAACHDTHVDDLLKTIHEVKVEHFMNVCQPDLALLNINGSVVAVIEVVVTHKPEQSVLEFYKDSQIILIQINLQSDSDLENVEAKLLAPDIFDFCLNPRCESCGNYQKKRKLWIIDGPCRNCDETMKVAILDEGNGRRSGPETFDEGELSFARTNGVMIEEHFSKTRRETYLANTCCWCGFFTGSHYLFEYFESAVYGDLSSEVFEIGYYCDFCDNNEKDNFVN